MATMNNDASKEVQALAFGPNLIGRRGDGYLVNGYRFHSTSCESKRRTQNSGVYVVATTRGYSSARDRNPKEDVVEYFGILEDVVELDYYGSGKVVLFKCKWYDSLARDRGVKTDDYGFTLVNHQKFGSTDEPFVMPAQVQQIFYVDDQRDNNWRVVIRTKPRDLCEDAEVDSDSDDLPNTNEEFITPVAEVDIENINWVRNDVDAELVENGRKRPESKRKLGSQIDTSRFKRRMIEHIVDENEDENGDEDEDEDEDEGEDEGPEDEEEGDSEENEDDEE